MPRPSPSRCRRRAALATAVVALVATASPALTSAPAGAAVAPLTTTDGVGIRIDENAILGPALELIENEIQPVANQMIYNGALANSPAGKPKSLHVTSNVELGFDFVNAGVAGYPQGGLKVHADLLGIEIRYIKDPIWPFADCSIWVRPDTATIDASAKVNTALLPAAPLQLNPITAYWDDDPSVSSSGICWTYLIDDFFDSIFSSGGSNSIADNIEAELNAQAQDLVNDLWADHVMPVISSLNEFGVTFNQVRTDDHGLIVTANLNASGGLPIPGVPGPPFSVAAAEDAGVTSNVNTLLANRGEVIVSIHPNVVNQFLTALNSFTGGYWASDYLPSNIETTLFGAANPAYRDDGFYYELTVTGQPAVKPTGTGGAPQMRIPTATLAIGHEDVGPIATFEGPLAGINLKTVVRPETGRWGPDFSAASMTQSMTRTFAVAGVTATPSTILPTAKTAVAKWNSDTFETFVNVAPISVGGLGVSLCTTCGRYSGDQRYTETFNVA